MRHADVKYPHAGDFYSRQKKARKAQRRKRRIERLSQESRVCKGKVVLITRQDARRMAKKMDARAYKCKKCGFWHLDGPTPRQRRRNDLKRYMELLEEHNARRQRFLELEAAGAVA